MNGDGEGVVAASSDPPPPMEWRFSQVFYERSTCEEVHEVVQVETADATAGVVHTSL
ncbi:unnamed protein product [Eruca vesicaria subsp. sativa]|uniref:Uncharacterized protein n=1 Tax=Eruca vesicaria subsp. sativa TaxID=29727 RepID=A0ABC8LTV6_ERUVS|nr:unnamed protein product [Eruca vesicaria subsp. sativa]